MQFLQSWHRFSHLQYFCCECTKTAPLWAHPLLKLSRVSFGSALFVCRGALFHFGKDAGALKRTLRGRAARRRAEEDKRLSMHSVRDKLKFFSQFLRNPKMIGSVIPTSDSAIATMLSESTGRKPGCSWNMAPAWAPSPADSRAAARRCAAGGDRHLPELRRAPPGLDRRSAPAGGAWLGGGSVETILGTRTGGDRADYVLSGLPLSTLPAGVAAHRGEHGAGAAPGGSFLIYQYSRWFLRLLDPWFARVDHRWV